MRISKTAFLSYGRTRKEEDCDDIASEELNPHYETTSATEATAPPLWADRPPDVEFTDNSHTVWSKEEEETYGRGCL